MLVGQCLDNLRRGQHVMREVQQVVPQSNGFLSQALLRHTQSSQVDPGPTEQDHKDDSQQPHHKHDVALRMCRKGN